MKTNQTKDWWEKPGLGIMYQIESRPGWIWNRNYDKFNASMKDENGKFKFNGPFCNMKKWVEFSKEIGVDYHIFEAKWHDGICYFDTVYTTWKTPKDYCKTFSEESKNRKIPFLFYYSSIFDHNPLFNDIQPLRGVTPSFIAMHHENKKKIAKYSMNFAKVIESTVRQSRNKRGEYDLQYFDDVAFHDFTYNPEKYEKYLLNQVKELIENYQPDGMWFDWYWGKEEASTFLVMDYMEENYSDVILTYNVSIRRNPRFIHYLSGEAHDVNTAWKSGNTNRKLNRPWELCGPVAYAWDVPIAREDPHEIFRIAAIIMANGGKFCFGLPSQMDGELYLEPAKNLELLGEWYRQRKPLFIKSIPMDYKGDKVPGVEINHPKFGCIGSIFEENNLIHLINFEGIKEDLILDLDLKQWKDISQITLEPSKKKVEIEFNPDKLRIKISKEDVDLADTIIRVISK
ncbi:MAG: alpha-L-fucosidase [Promethearchaeota archaeon]